MHNMVSAELLRKLWEPNCEVLTDKQIEIQSSRGVTKVKLLFPRIQINFTNDITLVVKTLYSSCFQKTK